MKDNQYAEFMQAIKAGGATSPLGKLDLWYCAGLCETVNHGRDDGELPTCSVCEAVRTVVGEEQAAHPEQPAQPRTFVFGSVGGGGGDFEQRLKDFASK